MDLAGPPRLRSNSYRWVILGLGTGSQACYSCISQGLPALAPALRTHYGLSLEQVGFAVSSVLLGMVASQLAWGYVTDRHGDRIALGVGLGGGGIALCAAAFAPTYLTVVGLLMLTGLLGASTNTASASAIARWFSARERGGALGIRQSAAPVGGAVGALTLPALAAWVGLGGSFLAFGILLVAAAAVCARWLHAPAPIGRTAHASRSGPGRGPGAPLRSVSLWRISACGSLLVMAQFGLIAFVVVYLHDEHGLSTGAAAVVLAALQLTGSVGRIAVGRLSDRTADRLRPVRIIGLLMIVGWPLLGVVSGASLGLVIPLIIIVGTLALIWNGLIQVAAIESVPPGRSGVALGLLNTALTLVAGLTPPLFATLVVHTSWAAAYALLAVPSALGVMTLVGMRAPSALARTERPAMVAEPHPLAGGR